jgi:hypothetical protein
MELQGTVKKLGETQTFASGFQKRELVLETDEQYKQYLSVDFLQDKIDLLNNVSVGDSVKIGINLNGRLWTNPQGEEKCFNSITAWRLEKVNGDTQQGNFTEKPKEKEAENPFLDEDDDLAF